MTVLSAEPDLVMVLRRHHQNKLLTLGELELWRDRKTFWRCVTLEPPWLANCPFVSCIPTGWYRAFRSRYEKGGYDTWELADVPGRTEIKPHIGNFYTQTDGCQLLGHGTVTTGGVFSITASEATHKEFMNQTAYAQNAVMVVLDEIRSPLGD